MTPHIANLINAGVLIVCSFWAFLTPEFSSWTALMPAGFGVALILCTPGVKAEIKVIAHVAVLLALIVLVLLIVPFITVLSKGNAVSAIRVAVMMTTCIIAKVAFIKSFRDARRRREQGSA